MQHTKDSAQRTAVVSGSTGALGQAICRELAAAGVFVVCGYAANKEQAEALAASVGGTALELHSDLGNALPDVIHSVAEAHGGIDILVNAAGINREASAPAMHPDDWQDVLNVNLGFAFKLTQAVLRHMMPRRYGRVVHISSIAGRAGGRGQINYATAKAGLERMIQVFALEVGRKGITVNAVAPGIIISPMTDRVRADHESVLLDRIAHRRFGEPVDVAKAVAFLASDDAGYINGVVLPVDGGMML